MSQDFPQRRSVRLKEYDYSLEGSYFVTVCTHDRKCLFGEVVGGKVELNQTGNIILEELTNLPIKYECIKLDTYIIMPNHVHLIITVGAGSSRPNGGHDNRIIIGRENLAPTRGIKNITLGMIVGYFKYQATVKSNLLNDMGINKIWQRNYYEHIVGDEGDLSRIQEYIQNNPINWEQDELFV